MIPGYDTAPMTRLMPDWGWRRLCACLIPLLLLVGPGDARADALARFSILERDGVLWLQDPGGQPYFSFGINVANRGETPGPTGKASPEAGGRQTSAIRYRAASMYEDDSEWAAATAGRLDCWGFNNVGGWGDWDLLGAVPGAQFTHTPVLHIGSSAGSPWTDMWSAQSAAIMDTVAREATGAADARVIGHYADNELDWWNGALFRETLSHPPTSGQRQRLIALLRDHYGDDWNRLLRDFEPEGAASFAELERAGQVFLRPGSSGVRAYRRFLEIIAERYYAATSEIMRRRVPGSLLLGDRYAGSYYPEQVRAAAAVTDVLSTNLKASWTDGTFARFYLDSLNALSGKPVIVSEVYLAAMENRSGNRNLKGGFPTVLTQAERAQAARRSMLELARLPYLVGVDWFQYYDEPPGGRFDGEDFNMGLVDVQDRPYGGLVQALSSLRLAELHDVGSTPRPDATLGVPPSPVDPAGRWRPFDALGEWDRERGFVPAATPYPFADLYLAWSASGLWLGLYAMDLTERDYYRDRVVPEVDRMRWRVKVNGAGPEVDVRVGTGRHGVHAGQHRLDEADVRTLAHDNRAVAAIRIPAGALGKASLAAGDVVELESILDAHARADRVTWSGRFRLLE